MQLREPLRLTRQQYNFKAKNLNVEGLNQLTKNTLSKSLLAYKTACSLKVFDLYEEFFKHMFE